MKVLRTFGLIVVVVLTCSAQQSEKRRPGTFVVYGPARSVRIERTEFITRNGQLIEGPRILQAIIKYNEDGTRQEHTVFRPDGSILSKVNEALEPDGRLLEQSFLKGNGDPVSRMVYQYDGNKKLIEQALYRPNGSIAHRTTFVYQDNHRLHESVGYDENGVVISKVNGSLDLKTHRMDTVAQAANQVVSKQTAFTDTAAGQVFEERVNGTQTELSSIVPLATVAER